MQKLLGASWKMKLAGALSAVGVAAGVGIAMLKGMPVDWSAALAAIMAALGVFLARENKVSSEDAGAK